MTFLEALATGRPMRRPSTITLPSWLFLGQEDRVVRWRNISSGELTGLTRSDYQVTDWEVML